MINPDKEPLLKSSLAGISARLQAEREACESDDQALTVHSGQLEYLLEHFVGYPAYSM